MRTLDEIYEGFPDIEIKGVKINSKECEPGDLFVCIQGVTADRHQFVEEAFNNGAVAFVASKEINVDAPVVYVDDPNKELPIICRKFYDYPDTKLKLIGVTGTNGKTTVASIIYDILGNELCGYQGTNGIMCKDFNEKIVNTTPGPERLYMYFNRFLEAGCKYLSLETSSEAFYRERLKDITFQVGILTNVTQDHLNVHETLENYIECKKQLFQQVDKHGFCILNIDDPHFVEFNKAAQGIVYTYGKASSDLQIVNVEEHIDKTNITLKYQGKTYDIESPLLGEFNAYNLAAAILTILCLGFAMDKILERINCIKVPNGRCEFLNYGQNYSIVLDYAHTPDAFDKIYALLNKIKKNRIITVTGSAGGREHDKRPDMGKIVLENSDHVIFTMDDPRNEDVNTIIDELVSTSERTNYERIIDRKEAIKHAFEMAQEGDIVLIAGKGVDNYMALGDEYVPYCDLDVIESCFNNNQVSQDADM